jgi:hypothetical protein
VAQEIRVAKLTGGVLLAGLWACAPAAEPKTAAALTPGQQCVADAGAWPAPAEDAPLRIEVSHLLVRHAELEQSEGAKRTREQACLRALEALQAVQSGLDWPDAVTRFSDAKSADLGRVSADELPRGFAETAFSLEVNQLSYVVESERGFHIILRTR